MLERKLLTLDEVADIASAAKDEGKTVVLTNGCFDLLHVGHIRYLEAAKREGDLVIVALNSDQSVRELKGSGRPVMGEQERAEILSALCCVDYVIVFDDPTVDAILKTMPIERREVFVLYEIEGLTGKEIADQLGVPEGTVASRLRTARAEFEDAVRRRAEIRGRR